MIINFITDKDNKDLLRECDELFEDLGIKYNSGNYRKNIVHYMEFSCEPASINIFYGYINNLLTEYSKNNILVNPSLLVCFGKKKFKARKGWVSVKKQPFF